LKIERNIEECGKPAAEAEEVATVQGEKGTVEYDMAWGERFCGEIDLDQDEKSK
jgi:hypothetical protein